MGQLSRSAIVSTGLALAGNDSLTTAANQWLNVWLNKQYDSWPWPFLQRRASGIALSVGSQSLSIGAGSNGVTQAIKRVIDPIWIYKSDYSAAGKVRVRQLLDGDVRDDETVQNPATNRGLPVLAKVRADTTTFGKWTLWLTPVPDKAYVLAIDHIIKPDALSTSTSDDTTVPLYPGDETMVKCVEAYALRYMRHEDRQLAMDELAAMAINDRVRYGAVDGTNDSLPLDTSIFR